MNLVRSWPQGQAGPTPLGWRLPQPLMPPRVNGWPMGVVPSSDAEGLLESAVAWWDASRYREGDRFLRNQGVAGELLDLRLGSSVAPNTNDPTWLGVQDSGYVYLPGIASNYMTIPNDAAMNLTGDVEMSFQISPDVFPPSANVMLFSRPSSQYALWITTAGFIRTYCNDGGGVGFLVSTASAQSAINTAQKFWIHATIRLNNGSGSAEFKWFVSTDGVNRTQVGATVTTPTFAIASFTGTTSLGSNTNTNNPFAGRVYRAQVLNGINGTPVLDIDTSVLTSGSATSFQALTGQTVTINRSTSGRKSVAQPGRGTGRATFLLGTDDYFEIPADRVWQHQLLNFGQADSFTVLAVVRQWATPSNTRSWISKGHAGGAAFWSLNNRGTTTVAGFLISDGTDTADTQRATTFGSLSVVHGVLSRSAAIATTVVNAVSGTAIATSAVDSLLNNFPVLVGRRQDASYQDFEFTAAAIFRRSLTQSEIQQITRYYGAS